MNISSILQKSTIELNRAGVPTPDIDSRVLLEHALEKDTIFLYSNSTRPLTNLEYSRFRRYVRKRKKGIPVAYITGEKEFFGYNFLVNKNVLVPRPETEWLVEQAIINIEHRISTKSNSTINILDMGTGSGCIIISLAKEIFKLKASPIEFNFHASDISVKALSIARKNAKKILFEESRELKKFSLRSNNKIKFLQSNLFSNERLHKKFDIIIANLPYVPKKHKLNTYNSGLQDSICFEPQNAIFADENGAAIIKQFLAKAKDRLNQKGIILIELDPRNAKELKKEAQKIFTKAKTETEKDMAGLARYLIIAI